MSEAMHMALCNGIGNKQHVLCRRYIVDILEKLTNELRKSDKKKKICGTEVDERDSDQRDQTLILCTGSIETE